MKSLELFAGCGGLAVGFERAGFEVLGLSELDKDACNTLRKNRPGWNVLEGDIRLKDFSKYAGIVDIVTGGFPCQAFSYSGNRLGLEDARGTLFYEFAKVVQAVQPTAFIAENVKGLLTHDCGDTLKLILATFKGLGYKVYTPTLLNANDFGVAQKRERLFILGVKEQYAERFSQLNPEKQQQITLKDALLQGAYYERDVNTLLTSGATYTTEKAELFNKVPAGGNWRNLNDADRKSYMGALLKSGGGKTGVMRRLSYEKPSPTILTSPAQKLTEFCHPVYSRPLSVRECARVQSFPDNWEFCGSTSSQYKQIGNAVPVNLAYSIGKNLYEKLERLKEEIK